ncbi:DUF2971 domain-containing protein [Methylovulum miyakonense]|uniref:DUF2971 domain-containing protein n=1 Tax=Methylovulum miyakonense TaxID=645578 RepID=UPI00036C3B80|nr:DUF2971 domain-containing protein [Methylovulum miyakonense]
MHTPLGSTRDISKMKHLYRFRTINSLFKFKELENQEIYFASPDQLNDPMEGFKDMIWCGDQVVWANLLKHYLLCLDDFFVLFLISNSSKDQKFQLSESKINIFKTKECFENSNQIDIYKEICNLFFSSQEIADFPKFLASRIKPIRKNELSIYLQSLHLHALNAIFSAYEKYAGIKNVLNGYELEAINLDGLSQINIIEENHSNAEDWAEKFFTFSGMILGEIGLITQFNHDNIKNNEMQFFSWFPKAYVKELEKLTYPNWYVACFMENDHNPSMWSHYADKHKGVCLKFKINSIDEKFFIRLSQTLNWDGRETKPTTHCHDNLFYKISNYTKVTRYSSPNFERMSNTACFNVP